MEYRVEQKYLVTEYEIAYLKERLVNLMEYDIHSGEEGYLIRSIYFDDLYDSCLAENEGGYDNREKYRVRSYNNRKDNLNLEIKSKKNGFTKKESEPVSVRDCLRYMEKDMHDFLPEDGAVKKRLFMHHLSAGLCARNIVEYERVALVEPAGNVRITFDTNIGGSDRVERFFEEDIYAIPVLPAGWHVLEVKYDEFLPDEIHDILKECSLRRTAFSKYYYARTACDL